MTIEFRGVSTASLGAMLKGYGIMAGVGATWRDARFWWTASGALATRVAELVDDCETDAVNEAIHDSVFKLAEWARDRGEAFEKTRKNKKKGTEPGNPPLEDEVTWRSLCEARVVDAEAVGMLIGKKGRPNPVLAHWGQDGSANLFNTLLDAGRRAKRADIGEAIFGNDAVTGARRTTKGSGVLFPEGIKRYATGTVWIHESKKPVGLWDFVLAMRGLLLFRGAIGSPRGSRSEYPTFPFILPGSVIRAQGSTIQANDVFLPTWSSDRPRTLAEFEAQVQGFQARVGRKDFASGAADFRRAVAGRAITGGFEAFHRFALEPRKPGQRSPQNQAISRGITTVGPASVTRSSLRFLLAPLDDSRWLERFRLRIGGKMDADSEKLALAKACFDAAVHAAIDSHEEAGDTNQIAVLKALWDLQVELWKASERRRGKVSFEPAPLLEGYAWQSALAELLNKEAAARLGWALASLGWFPVTDDSKRQIMRPVVEQLLPVATNPDGRLGVSDPQQPGQRVHQPGHKPAREFSALFWRRWLDATSLPVLPGRGTRPANVADVAALLRGEVDVKTLQRYFLAFLLLDKSGDAPPRPGAPAGWLQPAYAALRLWIELSARATPDARRPLDGVVPRGIATGTESSVASACRAALRRLRMSGLPGDWPDDARPSGKSVALPEIVLTRAQAEVMAAAVLVPVCDESVATLEDTLLVPPASDEPKQRPRMETAHA